MSFLDEEGKPIMLFFVSLVWKKNVNPWCERKNYSLVCKKSLFLIKELMYSLSTKEYNWSLINRQDCKKFIGMEPQGVLPYKERRRRKNTMRKVQLKRGFCLGFLPYRERRKIMECEIKREKKRDFHLGGSARREIRGLSIL